MYIVYEFYEWNNTIELFKQSFIAPNYKPVFSLLEACSSIKLVLLANPIIHLGGTSTVWYPRPLTPLNTPVIHKSKSYQLSASNKLQIVSNF